MCRDSQGHSWMHNYFVDLLMVDRYLRICVNLYMAFASSGHSVEKAKQRIPVRDHEHIGM